ncbi:MAG: Holliday junction resolvase RuvX [Cryomorphaceae bacterium]|nr:MAG: Holliday junction resolvase RuvX [Cryomorphaceae bacterium]|tara:strand:+ start:722 stop:1135 length:414 start_codon:yes stop_codon:yes gene_type:complete
MSKILAIDYGKKRCGFAISDEDQLIAFPLETIDNEEIYLYIKNIIKEEDIEKFVVGLPKNNINSLFNIEKEIKLFIKKIKQEYPFLSIFRVDERYTSSLAKLTIAKSDLKKTKRENKKLIDKISATIILQSFLKKLL